MSTSTQLVSNAPTFKIGNDIDKFINGSKLTARALPHMVVTLVTDHRDSTDGNPVILDNIMYDDLKAWVENSITPAAISDMKNTLFAATSEGVKVQKRIDDHTTAIKDFKKKGGIQSTIDSEIRAAKKVTDMDMKRAAMKALERAVFSYVSIVENPIRSMFHTIELPATGSTAQFETIVKDEKGEDKKAMESIGIKPISDSARSNLLLWSMTEEQVKDAAEKKVTDDLEAKRAGQVEGESVIDATLNDIMSKAGGDLVILKQSAKVIAKYNDEDAPKGDTRMELLAQFSALSTIFTPAQLTAYNKKHA
jgi:hypothetical protein